MKVRPSRGLAAADRPVLAGTLCLKGLLLRALSESTGLLLLCVSFCFFPIRFVGVALVSEMTCVSSASLWYIPCICTVCRAQSPLRPGDLPRARTGPEVAERGSASPGDCNNTWPKYIGVIVKMQMSDGWRDGWKNKEEIFSVAT